MKYIIDEEELIKIYTDGYNVDATKALINQMVDADILSPVEEMAECRIETNEWGQFIFVQNDETVLGYINYHPHVLTKEQKDLFNKLEDKNIKIYIEVIK